MPGLTSAAPTTPAPTSTTPRTKRTIEHEEEEGPEAKKLDKEASPDVEEVEKEMRLQAYQPGS